MVSSPQRKQPVIRKFKLKTCVSSFIGLKYRLVPLKIKKFLPPPLETLDNTVYSGVNVVEPYQMDLLIKEFDGNSKKIFRFSND
jgi:hypothetical protein